LIQVSSIANKPIKQAFKKQCASWKICADPGPGGKHKVDQKDVLSWLEKAMEEVNTKLSTNSQVSKTFASYGQVCRCEDQSELAAYLAKYEDNGVYKLLLNHQLAVDLELKIISLVLGLCCPVLQHL
jgi:adenosine deaminase